ncbi:hypothetical protein [Glutamicibacter sp. PS]|uniref:hypothetical protein n=1 Tax=Glutamicibacter sp. PS TaxID=3075634 RepID=UPI0028507E1F|nr:hypothetical protein [Glutamicibacter sp. PS]MDR4533219.1 hypothetical protein [Glutamicibacter sp. PS]
MPTKTIHGIDLTAPGGIEALLALHRQTFGDAVMLADDDADEDQDADENEDSDGEPQDEDADEDSEDEQDPDGAEALGDKGKKALQAMKDKLKASRKAEREAKAELQREKSSKGKTEQEQEAERERAERDAAILNKANERIVRSEIKAQAAGKLQNPALAVRLLDLSDFEVDEDGSVDEDEIAQAIDELLEKEPYLAVQSGKSGTQFDSARGKRKAKKYTKDDLKGMTSEQIADAYDKGLIKTP